MTTIICLRRALRATLFGVSLFAMSVVFADPPPHAKAHGWRKKNDSHYVGYTGRGWEHDYGVLEGRCNRKEIGTVLGAVVGGAIGSQIGEGPERTVAIIVGSVLGAAIGREIGRDLDDGDRACIGHALELARDGQPVRWTNDATGVTYVVTPAASAHRGDKCRSYKLTATFGKQPRTTNGRACRQDDGTWRIIG